MSCTRIYYYYYYYYYLVATYYNFPSNKLLAYPHEAYMEDNHFPMIGPTRMPNHSWAWKPIYQPGLLLAQFDTNGHIYTLK